MAILLQFIAMGLFILIGIQIYNAFREPRLGREARGQLPASSAGSPAGGAAAALRELENVRADLRTRYPILFGMLGGYLNEHTMREAGSIEAAVQEMIDDWASRRDEVTKELSKVLYENPDEEEVRAIILASCDATFEDEGYRTWLSWLLRKFNAL